jgi:hypothetical protein
MDYNESIEYLKFKSGLETESSRDILIRLFFEVQKIRKTTEHIKQYLEANIR